MSEDQLRGKSLTAAAKDVANGFFTVNPLTLKKFGSEAIKGFYHQLKKAQIEVRNSKFPMNDVMGIRNRNIRLQRLHQALVVLEHCARERRVIL